MDAQPPVKISSFSWDFLEKIGKIIGVGHALGNPGSGPCNIL